MFSSRIESLAALSRKAGHAWSHGNEISGRSRLPPEPALFPLLLHEAGKEICQKPFSGCQQRLFLLPLAFFWGVSKPTSRKPGCFWLYGTQLAHSQPCVTPGGLWIPPILCAGWWRSTELHLNISSSKPTCITIFINPHCSHLHF